MSNLLKLVIFESALALCKLPASTYEAAVFCVYMICA